MACSCKGDTKSAVEGAAIGAAPLRMSAFSMTAIPPALCGVLAHSGTGRNPLRHRDRRHESKLNPQEEPPCPHRNRTQPGTGTRRPLRCPTQTPGDLHLRINEGACRLKIAPGASDAWISGTHHDPSGLRPLSITQEGGTVRLSEQASTSNAWEWLRSGHGVADVPTFDLALGKAKPFRLTVEIGASANQLDLGGVPISRLAVRHGAGKTEIDFSAPMVARVKALPYLDEVRRA